MIDTKAKAGTTKTEIIRRAKAYGWSAYFSGHDKIWRLRRCRPRVNSIAFDRIVFANMVRELGIAHYSKETP